MSDQHHKIPTVLIVGMALSPHTARWVNCIRHLGVRIVVFPCVLAPPCPELEPHRPVRSRADVDALPAGVVGVIPWDEIPSLTDADVENLQIYRFAFLTGWMPVRGVPSADALREVIQQTSPDLVHSMELQHGAYLTLEARHRMPAGDRFPPWLVSSWGGDVALYRKFEDHAGVLSRLLAEVDAFHADCARDVEWALENGFKGFLLPQMPASGGVDFADYPDPARLPLPSQRKTILVKGYHSWAGRGMHLLLAIHLIAPRLKGFRILVNHGSPPVAAMVEQLASEDGLDIRLDAHLPSNADALARLATARLAIGYGIADGISTTLLEAMAVGTFMVQSDACCGDEWIEHGRTGLVVRQHDVVALSEAILIAATDDALVDGAVAENRAKVEARWSAAKNGPRIAQAYRDIIAAHG